MARLFMPGQQLPTSPFPRTVKLATPQAQLLPQDSSALESVLSTLCLSPKAAISCRSFSRTFPLMPSLARIQEAPMMFYYGIRLLLLHAPRFLSRSISQFRARDSEQQVQHHLSCSLVESTQTEASPTWWIYIRSPISTAHLAQRRLFTRRYRFPQHDEAPALLLLQIGSSSSLVVIAYLDRVVTRIIYISS